MADLKANKSKQDYPDKPGQNVDANNSDISSMRSGPGQRIEPPAISIFPHLVYQFLICSVLIILVSVFIAYFDAFVLPNPCRHSFYTGKQVTRIISLMIVGFNIPLVIVFIIVKSSRNDDAIHAQIRQPIITIYISLAVSNIAVGVIYIFMKNCFDSEPDTELQKLKQAEQLKIIMKNDTIVLGTAYIVISVLYGLGLVAILTEPKVKASLIANIENRAGSF